MKRVSWGLKHMGGIPLPRQTIESIGPKYNAKTNKWERLINEYPPGNRFDFTELDLSVDEALGGILLDIDHKFEGKVTKENIIATGHGLNTKFLRPNGWEKEKKGKKVKIKKIKKIKKKKIMKND